ncbi:serine/threonine-protein kinase [Synechocystis sp. PCC 7509]|uniref:serine/threonine-protein kinase n=1 Tax=Synechocystis sp. PCC 7509 TaxID=927677 RepID=UPI0002ACF07E|nr:serine/threonine-protein kinase [Synechocystis sp. PCC 7509]
MTDPNIGRLLAKRYQLQKLIGTGAMGQVYCANDILLGGVPVAVKFLALSIQNKKIRVKERFETEAKTCALLGQKSIHIVRVMDYGVDEHDTPFYVMEYLQGENLNDAVRLQPVTLARFLSLARQICLGLQCAHQGILVDGAICPIIHRDIKPSNMLVVQDPSFGELVKVLDFGIAKLIQGDSNQTKYYLGTLAYSSPEQMEGNDIDPRSDIYSLGVMMFEMITGSMPFQANTESFGGWYKAHHFQIPRSFASTGTKLVIPKEVEDLVLSCLAKSPDDRPQTIGEILEAIVALEQKQSLVVVSNPSPPLPLLQEESINRSLTMGVPFLDRSFSDDPVFQPTAWPKNKPIADIVFPQPIRTKGEIISALWVMLPQQEIQKRLQGTRFNQFLFISTPHPMMLWITALYNAQHGVKWLAYYMDLKTRQGQEITRLLGESGSYRLLLFARESPECVCKTLLMAIAPLQRQQLQQWVMTSQNLVSVAEAQVSKSLLRQEFEKLKPQILAKLQPSGLDSVFNVTL